MLGSLERNSTHYLLSVGLTENGWSSNYMFERWLEESFIPQARARAGNNVDPILLIIDGYKAHTKGRVRELCIKHNIHLYVFPAHTTHKLQPMDVGVFGPFARAWTERVEEVTEETGTGIPEWKFIIEYMSVREKAVTVPVIQGGWAKSGLEPFNPNIFTNADFAPSQATSTKVFLPSSFPTSDLPGDNTATTSQGNSAFDIQDILHTSNTQDREGTDDLEDTDGIETMSDVEGEVEARRASAFAPAELSSVRWFHRTTRASVIGCGEGSTATRLEPNSLPRGGSDDFAVILGQASDIATWLDAAEIQMDGSSQDRAWAFGEDEELSVQQASESPAQIAIVTSVTQADDTRRDDALRIEEEEDRFWMAGSEYNDSLRHD
jgi:hypothetical protein